ncbi:hypothetical protein B0H17DRAFT_1198008 [Mycena rosella]|uniref:DUF6534 domain-containing protein n=1 Tax=Mycena rosella TaxID=1033263 RepID=A0AAD7DQ18_MYCRO|nr:hypothetical protein B0H17DRAFT_1198008 [Mycena rosella]
MATTGSVINLAPASQTFVDNRATTLGAWVIAGFLDAILLGVVLCQAGKFIKSRRPQEGLGRHYRWLVVLVIFLSVLKTSQGIAIVWVQNVEDFMNPDVARTLIATAWYQVSTPLMTGIMAVVVQSFFALRFYMLSRKVYFVLPIACSMLLGFAGVCLSLNAIIVGNAETKVMWLLVHLICAFLTDLLITIGTCWALRNRNSRGLASTNSLINRLLRLVFESAVPPTIVAAVDLIMTQTLGAQHLLWHLVLNYALSKLYAISLLYTLNCINQYRENQALSQERMTTSSGSRVGNIRTTKRGDLELGNVVRPTINKDQVYVQTQIITHVSPSHGSVEESSTDVKSSGWQPGWDK